MRVTALIVAFVAGLVALELVDPWGHTSPPAPYPSTPLSANGVMIGVTTLALARNSARPWRAADLEQVNSFEQGARRHADVVMWFVDWSRGTFDPSQADAVRRRGSIPEISWEPWDSRIHPGARQPRYRLAGIVAGRFDGLIRRFALAVKRYGSPVRLRFAQEMNGRLYPWAEDVNGNHPGEFVRAWRHVHDLFAQVGATNVTWIWAPVVGGLRASLYPGDRYVDVVGVSGFNGGTITFSRRWKEFAPTFDPTLDAIHQLAPAKPVAVSEIASAEQGGDKAAWIRDMFADVQRRPYVREVVWFDVPKEADWRIASSPSAQEAFADAVGALRR